VIFRNSLAVTGALVAGYVFSFVLAPIMLARLGLAQFGVWAVTGAFATYAGLMDLGVTRALSRFVAFYDARGDRRAIEQLLGLGLIVVAVIGLIAAALAAAAAPLAAEGLGDVLSASDMRTVLLAVAAIFTFNATRSVMQSVPDGMQRMIPPMVAEVTGLSINFAFSVTALIASRHLVVYAVANAAAALVALVPNFVALRHVWRPVQPRIPSRDIVREVLGFSLKSQLSWIGELLNSQTDKIIIAVFIDVRAAGAFEIANRAVLAVKSLSIMSISAMVPAATQQITREGREVIPAFYRHYTTRSLGVAYGLVGFVVVGAPALLVAWLGDVPGDAIAIFVALTLANAVSLSTGVATSIALGEGKAGLIAKVSLLGVVLNLLFTVALTPIFGLWGVVAGTMISIVGWSAVFLVRFHRMHRVSVAAYFRAAGIPAAIAALSGVPIALYVLTAPVQNGDRLSAAVATAAFLTVYLALYWPVASRAGILPDRLRLRSFKRLHPSRA
jgi:O-antigen/teichoic acid export membrane protein